MVSGFGLHYRRLLKRLTSCFIWLIEDSECLNMEIKSCLESKFKIISMYDENISFHYQFSDSIVLY